MVYSKADSIFFLSLVDHQTKLITGVRSLKFPRDKKGEWIAYLLASKELVLYNLVTREEQRFLSVQDYNFANGGSVLLITRTNKANNGIELLWSGLSNKEVNSIWIDEHAAQISNYKFDQNDEQLLFLITDSLGENKLWYYKYGMDRAVVKVSMKTDGISKGLSISNDPAYFNQNGKFIFFKVQTSPERITPDSYTVPLDVWSYKDVLLISEQPKTTIQKYTACIAVDANHALQLENDAEQIITTSGQSIANNLNGDHLVVGPKWESDFWWNWYRPHLYYLVSLRDGTRKIITRQFATDFAYSGSGRYVVYFDSKQKHFFSYEVETGKTKKISQGILEGLETEYKQKPLDRTFPIAVGIAGWLQDQDVFFIYDNFDIWKVDVRGQNVPINITNGYGKRNHIKFKLVYEKNDFSKNIISPDNTVLITAFNIENKFNGFFYASLAKQFDPTLLTMGNFLLYKQSSQIPNFDAFDYGLQPIKAENQNVWLVKKQSFSQAPNFFLTRDFKTYEPLTNLQPQEKYNWLTAELITYKQLDGTVSQGILYKPENFDPAKKYPLLFSYYETFSYRLYEFPKPDFNRGRIDISWYVSRGYLVFTPDIHYSIASISGKVAGDHAVNSIVSAAKQLSKLPFVDGKRMGIQGHSFAGGETNYLIANSNLFAAACEAAGGANSITGYLSLNIPMGKVDGGGKQSGYEIGQGRFGATLWERPDLYIKASPVMKADKITTPLLIMHNQGDGAVDWTLSIEMYLALRRLQKPVWMLQYDEEDHAIADEKKAIDFTIRTNQFFDHYLKGSPPPQWMTVGIPAALKGIKNGIESDSTTKCFSECPICNITHSRGTKDKPKTNISHLK